MARLSPEPFDAPGEGEVDSRRICAGCVVTGVSDTEVVASCGEASGSSLQDVRSDEIATK